MTKSSVFLTAFKNAFVAKFPDVLFVQIKNIQSLLKGKTERYVSNRGTIEIKDRDIRWTTHRNRSHLYSEGFLHRGEAIGKSYLLENINFKNGDTVIDCGANMGDLQLYFRNKRLEVRYIAIEPNPIDFACLSKNMVGDSTCLNYALWDERGKLKFWVDSNSASSSLIEPPNFTDIIIVEAVRLDQLNIPGPIKLLKVEGEGAEPEILLGSSELFNSIEYISVDVGPERGVHQTSTREDVIVYLTQNNFEIVLENPYHRKTILFKRRVNANAEIL